MVKANELCHQFALVISTATDASGVVDPDAEVTALFARPLVSLEPLPAACVSFGGGVGGAAPTAT